MFVRVQLATCNAAEDHMRFYPHAPTLSCCVYFLDLYIMHNRPGSSTYPQIFVCLFVVNTLGKEKHLYMELPIYMKYIVILKETKM